MARQLLCPSHKLAILEHQVLSVEVLASGAIPEALMRLLERIPAHLRGAGLIDPPPRGTLAGALESMAQSTESEGEDA